MVDHTEPVRRQSSAKRYSRSARPGVGTGTVSLLMIFTVLCFATLAMLCLSTAASDRRIQQRGYQRAVDLAAAEGTAAEAMAELDEALLMLDSQGEAYLKKALQAAAGLGWEVAEAEGSATWTAPLNENNNLVTAVHINTGAAGTRFFITSQTTVYTGAWEAEPPGDLWTPEPGAE